MTTKERILFEALELFSTKGFEAVSMRDLGAVVGIRESSIYKHYSGKQAILDAIVELAMEEIEKMFVILDIPDPNDISSISRYGNMELEEVADLVSKMLFKQKNNEIVSRFRQLLTIEQYRNENLRAVYREVFMERQLEYIEKVFDYLVNLGILEGTSTKMMALQFYAPFFLLLYRLQDDEELEKEVKKYIICFLQEHVKGD